MKNIRFITNAILMVTISISFAASAFAQSDEILVEGNPPLTQATANSILKYYERGLGGQFTNYERDFLQEKLVEMWRKVQKENPKNLEGFIGTVEKINGWDDCKIKAHQQELTESLLADLKSAPRNEFYKSVLTVYDNMNGDTLNVTTKGCANNSNQTEASTKNRSGNSIENTSTKRENSETNASGSKKSESSDKPNFQPVTGAIKMSDLVGKWNKGTVSSYGYRNTVTNDYTSGYGAANMHEIRANGSFDYSNFAQISLYGCTTELFTSMKGRAAISGSQVIFSYVSGNVKGKDSCRSQGFDKPARISNATYQLERDGNHLRLCEVGAKVQSCLYKEEK